MAVTEDAHASTPGLPPLALGGGGGIVAKDYTASTAAVDGGWGGEASCRVPIERPQIIMNLFSFPSIPLRVG
jgi:hypothetical protein